MNSKTLTIRNVILGSGIPKICVPVIEKTDEAILKAAAEAVQSSADLVEWRCDHYDKVHDLDQVTALLKKMRQVLGEMPLLFTYRTKAEGGAAETEISLEGYEELNQAAIRSGSVDVIDMELRMGQAMAKSLSREIQKKTARTEAFSPCYLLISNHDFQKTPDQEELLSRYKTMESWGADLLKIAVMPQSEEDVLTLLAACHQASKSSSRPVIAISMGSLGLESRICGEAFGSAMTFGCLEKASAPGQMNAEQLRMLLETIHKAH